MCMSAEYEDTDRDVAGPELSEDVEQRSWVISFV